MNSTRNTIINIADLIVQFGATTIHEGLNLEVLAGEILSVVGASGTGKSVLLQTIVGLIRPSGGVIEIYGEDTSSLAPRAVLEIRRRCGVLFQDGALFGSMTVSQNIQLPMREHFKLPQRILEDLAALKLAMVGLKTDVGDKYPAELSGGMRKRAGLARALALDPDLLFLDEPTAGLDPIGAASFDQLIQELQKNLQLTVFMVTHDLDTIYTVSDRVAVLGEKKVLTCGSLDEVSAYKHSWVNEYFHGPRSRSKDIQKAVSIPAT